MKKRIEKLSDAQVARLPEVRDKWIQIGLRTGPGDLKRAWEGIKRAYVIAGREAPVLWVWLESPYRCVFYRGNRVVQ